MKGKVERRIEIEGEGEGKGSSVSRVRKGRRDIGRGRKRELREKC